jgi:hypothetical protein
VDDLAFAAATRGRFRSRSALGVANGRRLILLRRVRHAFFADALLAAPRTLRVCAAFLPAARSFRVRAAFLPAARSFRVRTALMPAALCFSFGVMVGYS